MKRKGSISWDNFIMRKHGTSIRKKIFESHVPFLRAVTAMRMANTLALLSKDCEENKTIN